MTTVNPLFVKLCIPNDLEEVLEGLAREILRRQPSNITRFAAVYFHKLLGIRKDAQDNGANLNLKTLIARGKFLNISGDDLYLQDTNGSLFGESLKTTSYTEELVIEKDRRKSTNLEKQIGRATSDDSVLDNDRIEITSEILADVDIQQTTEIILDAKQNYTNETETSFEISTGTSHEEPEAKIVSDKDSTKFSSIDKEPIIENETRNPKIQNNETVHDRPLLNDDQSKINSEIFTVVIDKEPEETILTETKECTFSDECPKALRTFSSSTTQEGHTVENELNYTSYNSHNSKNASLTNIELEHADLTLNTDKHQLDSEEHFDATSNKSENMAIADIQGIMINSENHNAILEEKITAENNSKKEKKFLNAPENIQSDIVHELSKPDFESNHINHEITIASIRQEPAEMILAEETILEFSDKECITDSMFVLKKEQSIENGLQEDEHGSNNPDNISVQKGELVYEATLQNTEHKEISSEISDAEYHKDLGESTNMEKQNGEIVNHDSVSDNDRIEINSEIPADADLLQQDELIVDDKQNYTTGDDMNFEISTGTLYKEPESKALSDKDSIKFSSINKEIIIENKIKDAEMQNNEKVYDSSMLNNEQSKTNCEISAAVIDEQPAETILRETKLSPSKNQEEVNLENDKKDTSDALSVQGNTSNLASKTQQNKSELRSDRNEMNFEVSVDTVHKEPMETISLESQESTFTPNNPTIISYITQKNFSVENEPEGSVDAAHSSFKSDELECDGVMLISGQNEMNSEVFPAIVHNKSKRVSSKGIQGIKFRDDEPTRVSPYIAQDQLIIKSECKEQTGDLNYIEETIHQNNDLISDHTDKLPVSLQKEPVEVIITNTTEGEIMMRRIMGTEIESSNTINNSSILVNNEHVNGVLKCDKAEMSKGDNRENFDMSADSIDAQVMQSEGSLTNTLNSPIGNKEIIQATATELNVRITDNHTSSSQRELPIYEQLERDSEQKTEPRFSNEQNDNEMKGNNHSNDDKSLNIFDNIIILESSVANSSYDIQNSDRHLSALQANIFEIIDVIREPDSKTSEAGEQQMAKNDYHHNERSKMSEISENGNIVLKIEKTGDNLNDINNSDHVNEKADEHSTQIMEDCLKDYSKEADVNVTKPLNGMLNNEERNLEFEENASTAIINEMPQELDEKSENYMGNLKLNFDKNDLHHDPQEQLQNKPEMPELPSNNQSDEIIEVIHSGSSIIARGENIVRNINEPNNHNSECIQNDNFAETDPNEGDKTVNGFLEIITCKPTEKLIPIDESEKLEREEGECNPIIINILNENSDFSESCQNEKRNIIIENEEINFSNIITITEEAGNDVNLSTNEKIMDTEVQKIVNENFMSNNKIDEANKKEDWHDNKFLQSPQYIEEKASENQNDNEKNDYRIGSPVVLQENLIDNSEFLFNNNYKQSINFENYPCTEITNKHENCKEKFTSELQESIKNTIKETGNISKHVIIQGNDMITSAIQNTATEEVHIPEFREINEINGDLIIEKDFIGNRATVLSDDISSYSNIKLPASNSSEIEVYNQSGTDVAMTGNIFAENDMEDASKTMPTNKEFAQKELQESLKNQSPFFKESCYDETQNADRDFTTEKKVELVISQNNIEKGQELSERITEGLNEKLQLQEMQIFQQESDADLITETSQLNEIDTKSYALLDRLNNMDFIENTNENTFEGKHEQLKEEEIFLSELTVSDNVKPLNDIGPTNSEELENKNLNINNMSEIKSNDHRNKSTTTNENLNFEYTQSHITNEVNDIFSKQILDSNMNSTGADKLNEDTQIAIKYLKSAIDKPAIIGYMHSDLTTTNGANQLDGNLKNASITDQMTNIAESRNNDDNNMIHDSVSLTSPQVDMFINNTGDSHFDKNSNALETHTENSADLTISVNEITNNLQQNSSHITITNDSTENDIYDKNINKEVAISNISDRDAQENKTKMRFINSNPEELQNESNITKSHNSSDILAIHDVIDIFNMPHEQERSPESSSLNVDDNFFKYSENGSYTIEHQVKALSHTTQNGGITNNNPTEDLDNDKKFSDVVKGDFLGQQFDDQDSLSSLAKSNAKTESNGSSITVMGDILHEEKESLMEVIDDNLTTDDELLTNKRNHVILKDNESYVFQDEKQPMHDFRSDFKLEKIANFRNDEMNSSIKPLEEQKPTTSEFLFKHTEEITKESEKEIISTENSVPSVMDDKLENDVILNRDLIIQNDMLNNSSLLDKNAHQNIQEEYLDSLDDNEIIENSKGINNYTQPLNRIDNKGENLSLSISTNVNFEQHNHETSGKTNEDVNENKEITNNDPRSDMHHFAINDNKDVNLENEIIKYGNISDNKNDQFNITKEQVSMEYDKVVEPKGSVEIIPSRNETVSSINESIYADTLNEEVIVQEEDDRKLENGTDFKIADYDNQDTFETTSSIPKNESNHEANVTDTNNIKGYEVIDVNFNEEINDTSVNEEINNTDINKKFHSENNEEINMLNGYEFNNKSNMSKEINAMDENDNAQIADTSKKNNQLDINKSSKINNLEQNENEDTRIKDIGKERHKQHDMKVMKESFVKGLNEVVEQNNSLALLSMGENELPASPQNKVYDIWVSDPSSEKSSDVDNKQIDPIEKLGDYAENASLQEARMLFKYDENSNQGIINIHQDMVKDQLAANPVRKSIVIKESSENTLELPEMLTDDHFKLSKDTVSGINKATDKEEKLDKKLDLFTNVSNESFTSDVLVNIKTETDPTETNSLSTTELNEKLDL